MKNIIRVFPRRTRATPDDSNAVVGGPELWSKADEVHVSVSFTWDIPEAERLVREWERIATVRIGGPATGERSEEFEPGMYVKQGYVITSRGCPNRCWFCSVPKREGNVREIVIKEGWNILDDNLLACSESHIRNVFSMLSRQKERPQFTGGLEAKRLVRWMADGLFSIHPEQVFFAYDTPDDLEPLMEASMLMQSAGFSPFPPSKVMRCYVLCGYPKDSMNAADIRMRQVVKSGMVPMAMLWKDHNGNSSLDWRKFQRVWSRPAIIYSRMKAESA